MKKTIFTLSLFCSVTAFALPSQSHDMQAMTTTVSSTNKGVLSSDTSMTQSNSSLGLEGKKSFGATTVGSSPFSKTQLQQNRSSTNDLMIIPWSTASVKIIPLASSDNGKKIIQSNDSHGNRQKMVQVTVAFDKNLSGSIGSTQDRAYAFFGSPVMSVGSMSASGALGALSNFSKTNTNPSQDTRIAILSGTAGSASDSKHPEMILLQTMSYDKANNTMTGVGYSLTEPKAKSVSYETAHIYLSNNNDHNALNPMRHDKTWQQTSVKVTSFADNK